MAVLALALVIGWVVIVAVARAILAARAGGGAPLRFADRRGSAQWWSRVLSSVGFVLAIAAPVAELAGLPAIAALDRPAVSWIGVGVAIAGIVVSVVAQAAMGASWRGDVDPDARTELVTTGPFRVVRNPILTGTLLTALGIALVVPNVVALAMLGCVVVALEIQVRLVEEPYLLRVHGDAYRAYASRTGRFVPGLGRLRA